jgi:hypothetical protein
VVDAWLIGAWMRCLAPVSARISTVTATAISTPSPVAISELVVGRVRAVEGIV